SGNVLDSAARQICAAGEDQNHPAIAWGHESFLSVWDDLRNQDLDIYGARIDSLGQVLDFLNLPIRVDPGLDQRRPSIAFDGENYLVVWQSDLDSTGLNYRIEGLRVSFQGEVLDHEPLLISTSDYGSYPDVAFAGGKYLVVWLDAYYYDIYGAFVETSGAIGSQIGIRTASGLQQNPKVASNGSEFLVVWEDFGMHWPNSDILATRVTSGGSVLDPAGIMVATTEDSEERPSATFNGYNFVVAWKRVPDQTAELYAARVSSEGAMLDPDGILISDVSLYSGTSISFGPVGPSLMLYSKHQADPFNSPRLYGALFWGGPEPNLPPEPFSLILPADQDTAAEPVSFDWEDAYDPNSADQVTYTLFVSSSDQFPPESTLVVDSLISSQGSVSPQQDGLAYWWKVRAQDPWGETSWSTQVFSFRLESYGDVTGDGTINLGDVVFLINFLFRGGPSPQPVSSGDVNGDCEVNLGDVVYLINYLFRAGPRPRAGCP
ncbi:MAG: dockerin type I repeat-containing protein, partial [Candidatus Zixiibacteriota bacterium]